VRAEERGSQERKQLLPTTELPSPKGVHPQRSAVLLLACVFLITTPAQVASAQRRVDPTLAALCEASFQRQQGTKPLPPGSVTTKSVLTMLKTEREKANQWVPGEPLPFFEADLVTGVQTVLCINETRHFEGSYTDGAAGYRLDWDVRLVRKQDGVVLSAAVFTGGLAPPFKTGGGPAWGGEPERKLLGWIAEGLSPRTIFAHDDWVWAVAFSPDGKTLASGSSDGTIKVWDLARGMEVQTLRGHTEHVAGVAFAPDGKKLASASWDKTVKIWDVASGKDLLTLTGHTDGVSSVAFAPGGAVVASGSFDNTIKCWNVSTGTLIRTLAGHTHAVIYIAFAANGTTLVSGDYETVRFWDFETGRQLRTLNGRLLAVSADGKLLAAGNGRLLELYDVSTGTKVAVLRGHTGDVVAAAFSPDRKMLASGGDDTVKVWALVRRVVIEGLRGHRPHPELVAFSPDGTTLASGGWEGVVKLWDVATGR